MRITGLIPFALVAILWPGVSPQAGEEEDAIARGRLLVERLCVRCHAIGAEGDSAFDDAPPFRVIASRYDVELLAEAFAEGIVVGHPAMPVFEFPPDLIGDLLAYLRDLEPAED